MTSQQPPKAATWLLRHLGCSPQNEAVIGDLVEQYRRGHSRGWYWRQVLIAIVIAFLTELRLNKLFILCGLFVGTALQFALSFGMRKMMHLVPPHTIWTYPNIFLAIDIAVLFLACAINARVVAQLCRRHARPVILAFVVLQSLIMLMPIGSVPFGVSWIFGVGGGINAVLFSGFGIQPCWPKLYASCALWHFLVIAFISAFLAAITLIVASGAFRDDSGITDTQRRQVRT